VEMAENTSGDPEAGTPGSEPTVEELLVELDAARTEADDAREKALRAQAEAENVRRRAQRDVENAHKYGIEKFAAELLPVADSLERAVQAARANVTNDADSAIAEGVELSLKLFLDVLARADIVQLDPLGEPFDPQFHEAMTTVESADAEPGSVVQVLQKGFTLNGRLVRAALVMVAKSPA
jgi:molecular chaperone GrpE